MMNKRIFQLIILLLLSVGAMAQPNKKVGPALTKFLNTEFMIKYRDLRIEAESAAISAQSRRDEMKPAELFRLRTAYDQTASRANQILEGVKQDFLNGKKLKTIAQFPDMYSDGLRYKLQELADFYAANFQQALADASVNKEKEQVDGSAVLLLVVELIGLTKGLTNYFADIKREARQYSEAHLQENLVQPYRWRYWDELSGSASPYEKFERSSEMNFSPRTDDPLDQQLQKMNQAISNFPVKDHNNSSDYNSSGFEMPMESGVTPDSNDTFQYEDWSPTNPPSDPTKQQQPANPQPLKGKTPAKTPATKQPEKAPKASPKTDH